jgi:4-aminobutyrate aminotransferase-like enzyme/Ser/Thr protein kinase RdoA (MazF antagonist)
LLALRTSPPAVSAAQAERVLRDIYGLVGSLRALPGERDCNFHLRTADGRAYVLKIIDRAAGPETVDCQLRVLRHLAEQDPSLPIPRVFPGARGEEAGSFAGPDGIGYTTCLLSFLPGRLLAEVPAERRLLEVVGDTLARLDRSLQGFFHPALGQRLAWDVRRLPELAEHLKYIDSASVRSDIESVIAAFQERASALGALRSQAVHGDCHAQNLLVDPAAVAISGILDFGDMIHAPRILEPAVTMSELLTEDLAPLAATSAVLEAYARRQPLEGAEIDMLYDLITARHAVTVLVHAWRRRHDAAGARVLDRSAQNAARSLRTLMETGRNSLTRDWHAAAGTRSEIWAAPEASADLARRHRLMGKGSELFYERPLHLVRGAGVWLFDPQGHAYLDVYNNVPHVGHAHPAVVRAVQSQAAILATHTRYLHSGILDYAERLLARLPSRLDACIFVNSGSEANDVAWRMARFATGHEGALVMQNAYHGITHAVAALTPGIGQPREPHVATVAPPPPGLSSHETAGGAAQIAAVRADVDAAVLTLAKRGFEPAAFYIDTALTSSGVYDPPTAWGAAVTERIRAAGGLIVADEVQYGMGRPGSHFWGFERRGLDPDIVTLGKPVANGYPMGVVIANRDLLEAFQAEFGFFSTFGGSAVAAAAGLAVLDVLEREELMANAERTGAHLRRRLTALAAEHSCLGELRGAGLLYGLEVQAAGALSARQCAKRIINTLASEARVLIGYEGPDAAILKLRPPMPFGREHVERLVEAIDLAARGIASQE